MSKENKFHEVDKAISEKIMSEFKGKTTEVICPDCKGKKCKECNCKGHVTYSW